jgi:outer membrane protein assembly factor BamB
VQDAFSRYEVGLSDLLARLDSNHPRYAEALTLQARLLENIAQARQYGDTETRRAEWAQIVDALNRLSLDTVGKPFAFESHVSTLLKQRLLRWRVLAIVSGILAFAVVIWFIVQYQVEQEHSAEAVLVTTTAPISTSVPDIQPTVAAQSPTYKDPLDWLHAIAPPIAHSLCEESGDWPMTNKDPSNNEYTHDFLALPLQLAWQITVGPGMSRPVVADGRAYMVDGSGKTLAVDVLSGEIVWESQIASLEWEDTGLAYDDGSLFLASYDGTVYALDAKNGQVLWNYSTNSQINSSPVVFMTTVFVGTWHGQLLALDAKTGTLLWSFDAGSVFKSDVAAKGNMVYAVSRYGVLFALEAPSGREVWRLDIGNVGNGRTSVVYGETVYISSSSQVLAVDANSGDVVWTQPLKGLFSVNSVSVDEYLVYVSIPDEYEIVALDARTGEIRWRTELRGPPSHRGPVVTSRFLFTRMSLGSVDALVALDKLRGTVLWQKELAQGSYYVHFPGVVVANHLLIANVNDTMFAFESSPGRLLLTGNSLRIWDPTKKQVSKLKTQIFLQDCAPLPDKTNLVCVGSNKARWDLYTVEWDTREIAQITNFAAKGVATLVVSPLGGHVAFAFGTGEIDHGNLYIVDLEKQEAIRVTNDFCGARKSFSWSPDNQWLVFTRCGEGEAGVVQKVCVNGQEVTTLGASGKAGNLSWSPDGLWIAYVSHDGLALMNPNGSQKMLVANLGEYYVSWSPSGQQIATEPWVDNGTGIYVLTANGSKGKWITRYRGNIFPGHNPYSWSLDGRYIVYLDSMERIDILDVCTGDLVESLALGNEFTTNIKWIP